MFDSREARKQLIDSLVKYEGQFIMLEGDGDPKVAEEQGLFHMENPSVSADFEAYRELMAYCDRKLPWRVRRRFVRRIGNDPSYTFREIAEAADWLLVVFSDS